MRAQLSPVAAMSLALALALVACGGGERGSGEPASREGSEVVGRDIANLLPATWIGAPVPFGTPQAPPATLVRFWTDACRFCERSLPEIEALRERHGPRGLETVGVYHPKPARDVDEDTVRAAAQRLGYTGPLALDPHWDALRAIWPERSGMSTSSSFLLDRDGVVRYVHPGPEFVGDDLALLEQAIDTLLSER